MGVLARQTSWITLLTAAGLVLGFLNMSLLFPRYLPAADFGLLRLVVSIAIVAGQVAHLGLEATLIRYLPYLRGRDARRGGLLRGVLLAGTLGTTLAIIVLWAMHAELARWFSDRSDRYGTYGLVVLPLLIAEVYFLLLRGYSRAVHRSIAPVFVREFLLRGLQTGLIIAHVFLDLSFPVFLGLFTATFVLTTLALIAHLWRNGELIVLRKVEPLPARMRSSMKRYAMITLGVGVSGVAAGNIDQVMLAAMLHDGLEKVAYYAVAMFMASVIMVPSRAMVQPALPLIAEAWRRRDHAHIAALYRRSTTLLLAIGGFVALCICTNVSAIYTFMRPEYAAGARVLVILCVANLVNLAGGLGGSIIGTSRSYLFDASSGLLYLGLNVVLDYLFILWWGMEGVAWSTLASMVIVIAWRVAFLHRRFGFWPYDGKALGLCALAGALAALVVFLPSTGQYLADITVRCTLIALVYGGLLWKAGVVPDIEAMVRKRLRPRSA